MIDPTIAILCKHADTAARWAAALTARIASARPMHFEDAADYEAAIRGGRITIAVDGSPRDLLSMHTSDRMTAAAMAGIGQVVVATDLDGLASAEFDVLGQRIAERASAARGPTRIVLPPDADPVLRASLRNWIYPADVLVECEATAGDAGFEQVIGSIVVEMITMHR
jgi:hypothetical protein